MVANAEYSVSFLSLQSSCTCFSQFVSSIHFWTDVPKNFTVKLVTKTTVLLTWKFSDSRSPYRCMVSDSVLSILFKWVPARPWLNLHVFDVIVNSLFMHILPQIEYNRQKVDIDARMTKALITNLRPNVTYEFRITCQESSDGGPKHKLIARTAPPILIRNLSWTWKESRIVCWPFSSHRWNPKTWSSEENRPCLETHSTQVYECKCHYSKCEWWIHFWRKFVLLFSIVPLVAPLRMQYIQYICVKNCILIVCVHMVAYFSGFVWLDIPIFNALMDTEM